MPVTWSSSLDYEAALDKLAQLVFPTFADWCAVDIKEDDQLRLVAVAHATPPRSSSRSSCGAGARRARGRPRPLS